MSRNRLAYNSHPPDNYNPKMFLICCECCKTFKGDLEEMIRLGWIEYVGKHGKIAICPDCEKNILANLI